MHNVNTAGPVPAIAWWLGGPPPPGRPAVRACRRSMTESGARLVRPSAGSSTPNAFPCCVVALLEERPAGQSASQTASRPDCQPDCCCW